MQWLRECGMASRSFDALITRDLTGIRQQPTLRTAQANFASLREVLHLSDAQVRPKESCPHAPLPMFTQCAASRGGVHACRCNSNVASADRQCVAHVASLRSSTPRWPCQGPDVHTRMGRCREQRFDGVQIITAMKHLHVHAGLSPGHQLALCNRDPAAFRASLDAHVAAMAPHGFNAHALGVLAVRNLRAILGSPEALAAQFVMLRGFFHPTSDELAAVLVESAITQACLPAAPPDLLARLPPRLPTDPSPLTRLHKAVLTGAVNVLVWSRDGLERHMQKLAAAGLCADAAVARRDCMRSPGLLRPHTLEWFLVRKAAVLEARGTPADARAVCVQSATLWRILPVLLLSLKSGCALLAVPSSMLNFPTCLRQQHIRQIYGFLMLMFLRLQHNKLHIP